MARPDKAAAVAELTDAFRDSSAAVLTEYRGLTVAQLKELRRSLAPNATYAVVKNTLTKIAAREAGVDTIEPLLEGPSAIAFVSGDAVDVAKRLRDFGRTYPLLVIKGGVFEGKAISADDVRKLADLESREVLLSKLAGAMKGSLQQAVSTFAAPLAQMARVLGALEAKGGAAPAAEAPAAEAAVADTPAAEAAEAAVADTPAEPDAEPEAPAQDATGEAPAAEATDQPTEAPAEADAADGETSTSEATEQE